MEKYVIRDFPRPSPDLVRKFAELDVSTVYEAQGKQGLMSPDLRPIQSGVTIAGSVVTAVCQPGDNLMIHAAVEVCRPGDVLVVTTCGISSNHGMIGELLALALKKKGVLGVVLDAGVRDVRVLREMGFPVWAKTVHSQGTTKSRAGWVNAPTVCGGEIVRPGDIILADDDGVCIVRKEEAEASLQAAQDRMKKEEVTREQISRGELSVDFYNLRPVLEKEGVKYYDTLEQYSKYSKGAD